ncbi:hypothetical protein B0T26DRAFT_683206 [Lasiosphaeria miniovina]|uniref:Telomeric repeat-binding factor 2-interacting protein 1 n=1 Tax=Lasiosphaeria miniovina TaxID=1954250 RepID=A0AA40BFF7_9PEZI|nr:uncharacterized protein B0T26DRAFT_683206 [Lasiosphaeria miniovina]KAK0733239.1 hypothetical protein B0T26DRAFT_683206 [Lasiosphaeria miniovina]
MPAHIVYDGHAADTEGTLFEGTTFWVAQRVPSRQRILGLIKSNGGKVVLVDKQADIRIHDHARKDVPSGQGFVSWKFIEESVKKGDLCDVNDYIIDNPSAPVSALASARASAPARASVPTPKTAPVKQTRTPFTREDDELLGAWVRRCRDQGESIGGNAMYQKFAEKYPHHTWQSWKDRFRQKFSGLPEDQIPGWNKPPPASPSPGHPSAADATRAPVHQPPTISVTRPAPVHQSRASLVTNETAVSQPKTGFQSSGTKRARVFFDDVDDELLVRYVTQRMENGKGASGRPIGPNGNIIFQELADQYPHHTMHSWRDRWVRHLSRPEEPDTSDDDDEPPVTVCPIVKTEPRVSTSSVPENPISISDRVDQQTRPASVSGLNRVPPPRPNPRQSSTPLSATARETPAAHVADENNAPSNTGIVRARELRELKRARKEKRKDKAEMQEAVKSQPEIQATILFQARARGYLTRRFLYSSDEEDSDSGSEEPDGDDENRETVERETNGPSMNVHDVSGRDSPSPEVAEPGVTEPEVTEPEVKEGDSRNPSGDESGTEKIDEEASVKVEPDMEDPGVSVPEGEPDMGEFEAGNESDGPETPQRSIMDSHAHETQSQPSSPLTEKKQFSILFVEMQRLLGTTPVPDVWIGGKSVNIWDLWQTVRSQGSTAVRDWENVAENLGLDWIESPDVTYQLKGAFDEHLGPLEECWDEMKETMDNMPDDDEFGDAESGDGGASGDDEASGDGATGDDASGNETADEDEGAGDDEVPQNLANIGPEKLGLRPESVGFASSPPIVPLLGVLKRKSEGSAALPRYEKRRRYGLDEEIPCTPVSANKRTVKFADTPTTAQKAIGYRRTPHPKSIEPQTQDFNFAEHRPALQPSRVEPETQDFSFGGQEDYHFLDEEDSTSLSQQLRSETNAQALPSLPQALPLKKRMSEKARPRRAVSVSSETSSSSGFTSPERMVAARPAASRSVAPRPAAVSSSTTTGATRRELPTAWTKNTPDTPAGRVASGHLTAREASAPLGLGKSAPRVVSSRLVARRPAAQAAQPSPVTSVSSRGSNRHRAAAGNTSGYDEGYGANFDLMETINHFISLGYKQSHVVTVVKAIKLDPDPFDFGLAGRALELIKKDGQLPGNMQGVWTPRDDDVFISIDPATERVERRWEQIREREIARVMEKHGRDKLARRREFLWNFESA